MEAVMSDEHYPGEREQLATIHQQNAAAFAAQGGVLRCAACSHEEPLGDAAKVEGYLVRGWPKHCGATMVWEQAGAADPAAWPELTERSPIRQQARRRAS
jgi:hypothetical protein